MTTLAASVEQLLKQPTPESLWDLQPALLAHPDGQSAYETCGHFFRYLCQVKAMMDTRQFPLLATGLAVASTGINISEEIFSKRQTNLWNLVADGLRLALDTLSTYQFVLQIEPNFLVTHDTATWEAYRAYWQISVEYQPDLDSETRTRALNQLFQVVHDPKAEVVTRVVFLIQLFQWALILRLLPLLVGVPSRE